MFFLGAQCYAMLVKLGQFKKAVLPDLTEIKQVKSDGCVIPEDRVSAAVFQKQIAIECHEGIFMQQEIILLFGHIDGMEGVSDPVRVESSSVWFKFESQLMTDMLVSHS